MATGLMIIGVGKHTKVLYQFLGGDKTYEATIDLSKMSDTRDAEHWDFFEEYTYDNNFLIKHDQKISLPTQDQISEILKKLVPAFELPLPAFSAKKIAGQTSYDLARSGHIIERTQTMKILEIEIVSYHFPEVQIVCKVGSGTYIRSIGYRLGQQLGTGGILTALRRTSSGEIFLKEKPSYEHEGIGYEILEE